MKLYTAKPIIDEKTISDVVEVLKSGVIAQGPKVSKLEEKFSQSCKVKYAAAVNSGTAALHSALFAAGIKPGEEVITSPFTFVATANSILMAGGKPVFVDIDSDTFNISPKKIEEKITSATKAIIPVHLFGLMADMIEIMELAHNHSITVIEDAAQAHDAEINNKKAGSFGDLGAFSFYATKNIMSAEGGLVTSDNLDFIQKIKSFRHHGQSPDTRYNYIDFGYNYRMTDIHAAIGINQLERLNEFTKRRRENAFLYNKSLDNIEGISIPYVPEGYKHVYHQYTIIVDENKYGKTRQELIARLNQKDIFPGIFYPQPLHLIPTFRKFGYKEGDFPVAEKISKQVLSLPVHPSVNKDDILKIAETINL